MNPRRALRALGLTIGLAAVVWILWRFAHSGALSLLASLPSSPLRLGLSLAAAASAYAATLCVLAYAWWRMLASLAPQAPPCVPTMATWATSQYGRYLPGNIAHLALRHVWSRRYAIPHATLGLAAFGEAALLLFVALVLISAAGEKSRLLPGVDAHWLLGLLLAGFVAGLIALAWLRRLGGVRGWVPPRLPPTLLASVLACDLVFFAATASILCGIGHLLGVDASWATLLVAGAASWAAGFIVIGAPAGLGVREATFVALTAGALGEEHALLLIALYRVATFLGDTLLFGIGLLVMRRHRAPDRGPAPA